MREKIKNVLTVNVEGLDLTQISDVEFYVRQYGFFGKYAPEIVSAGEMLVTIPFKDAAKLRKFVSERSKILPRRITGTCAKHQRELTTAIKRARQIAILPYISD